MGVKFRCINTLRVSQIVRKLNNVLESVKKLTILLKLVKKIDRLFGVDKKNYQPRKVGQEIA